MFFSLPYIIFKLFQRFSRCKFSQLFLILQINLTNFVVRKIQTAMQLKIGDIVRYLNAVGGGKVVRIDGDIAYVDEDGFETPVLMRECVVVGTAPKNDTAVQTPKSAPKPTLIEKEGVTTPTTLPVIETKRGDIMNVVLGFEASDLKALSQATFDAYIVNDSNYYIYVSVAIRAAESNEWTLRYDGLIEPNIQEFIGEFLREDLPSMDRIEVQILAFKRDKVFESKKPYSVDIKVDTTKFAKLHCFRPNPYFDVPVIAFDIVSNDKTTTDPTLDKAELTAMISRQETPVKKEKIRTKKEAPKKDVIEVDLHIDELVDTTAGLTPADMLNLQIDKFCKVMNENLRHIGQKIVFIHGKGEGVLRQALMKELTHRYKGHDVQDASFREYGFGATQVTIRSTSSDKTKKR